MSQQTINTLVNTLGENKDDLLYDIKSRIRKSVTNLGSQCFSVIEIKSHSTTQYDPLPPSIAWGERFIKFCRQQNYNGNVLDSPVTETVQFEVSEAFLEYYQGKSEEISDIIAKDIANNEEFINSLVDSIYETNIIQASASMTKYIIKQKLKAIIISSIQSAQSQAIGTQLIGITGSLVTQLSGTITGKIILRQLLIYTKIIVAKILASSAFRTMVVAAVKKFAAVAIIGTVSHFLWSLLGAKVAAALGGVVIPILTIAILGWVAYEIGHMPEKLADKLADEIGQKLNNEMDKINQEIAENIYNKIGENIGGFTASLVSDSEFLDAINNDINYI